MTSLRFSCELELSVTELWRFRGQQKYLPHGYIIEKSGKPPVCVVDLVRSFYLDEKRILRKWMKFGMSHVRKKQPPGHFDFINNYIASLKNDSSPPVIPEDGENMVKLLEHIEESLNEQGPVAVHF